MVRAKGKARVVGRLVDKRVRRSVDRTADVHVQHGAVAAEPDVDGSDGDACASCGAQITEGLSSAGERVVLWSRGVGRLEWSPTYPHVGDSTEPGAMAAARDACSNENKRGSGRCAASLLYRGRVGVRD